MYPAKADKIAPIKNEMAITGLEVSSMVPDQARIKAVTTAK
jgi:hypothetical protein